MDYRTKPTVEAGIKIRVSAGDTTFVEYQPGNGTRYCVLLHDTRALGVAANNQIGLEQEGGWVVSFPDSERKTVVLSRHGYLAHSYLAEKIGSYSASDVAVIAELLAYLTGRRAEPAGPSA